MIDIKELRIGNSVHSEHPSFTNIYDKQLAVATISSLEPVTVWIEEYDNEISYKHIHPIPLDAEWLERFGFEHSVVYPGEDWYRIGKWAFMLDAESDHGIIEYYYLHGVADYTILYVHQLQNLMYALTGTELTVKETA